MTAATQTLKPTIGQTLRANEDLLRAALGDVMAQSFAHIVQLDLVEEELFLKVNAGTKAALLRAKQIDTDTASAIVAELDSAYDLLRSVGAVASVSVQVTVPAGTAGGTKRVREEDEEDDSTFLRRSTRGRFNTDHTLDFADFAPYLGLELVDMTGTIVAKVREARSGGRGLFGVQDSHIAENLATLATTREGTVEILKRDGNTVTLQILNTTVRREAAGNLINLARSCGIDDALIAAADYYRSGAIDGAMRTMGNSNVVSTTDGKVTPRAIRERVRAALVAITQLMEQQFDAAIMKKIARLHKLVTIPSLKNRGVVMSFGYALGEQDNPLEILLSDPSHKYAREVATFEFFATLREGLKHAATFRDDMSDEEFISSFLPAFCEIGDRYATAVANLARVSPKPANLGYGALVGVGQVYDSIMAYVSVDVSLGADGSLNVKATAAVATTTVEEAPVILFSIPNGSINFETGAKTLEKALRAKGADMSDFLTLQSRLAANIREARLHGETGDSRNERSRITAAMNELCTRHGFVTFNDMAMGSVVLDDLPDNPLTVRGNETRVDQRLNRDGLAIEYSYAYEVYMSQLPLARRGLEVTIPRDIKAKTMQELAQLVADVAERRRNLQARGGR